MQDMTAQIKDYRNKRNEVALLYVDGKIIAHIDKPCSVGCGVEGATMLVGTAEEIDAEIERLKLVEPDDGRLGRDRQVRVGEKELEVLREVASVDADEIKRLTNVKLRAAEAERK